MDTKRGGEEEKTQQVDLSRKSQASVTSSPSSSPTREFSFMISLHPSSAGVSDSFAIDLSPADEIFFRGHLLPLHLISNFPIAPEDHKPDEDKSDATTTSDSTGQTDGRMKRKSSSSSWLTKWRKGSEICDRKAEEAKKKKYKVIKFELAQLLKKYLRMVKPNLFSGGKRRNCKLRKRSCSFIEDSSLKEKQELEGRRRRGLSAPATMQTSPTNSGNDLTTSDYVPCTSNGSMEELHTAIQAAIAHCKNSVAVKNEMLIT